MMLRRTPCVGTCSTTYGDLVCRGCKRFSHEIVEWNGFDVEQRRVVWERLLRLRAGAADAVLEVHDEARLRQSPIVAAISGAERLDVLNLVYEALQRLQWREPTTALDALGVRLRDTDGEEPDAAEILTRIDREFYQRSLAHYERNFRISAR
jgi:uncharacterized protein